ncbi:hypothetical protein L1887_47181 [Cichorium endivia]|nr:hypothetical protein L1887_47181 [Cichorium endivia]
MSFFGKAFVVPFPPTLVMCYDEGYGGERGADQDRRARGVYRAELGFARAEQAPGASGAARTRGAARAVSARRKRPGGRCDERHGVCRQAVRAHLAPAPRVAALRHAHRRTCADRVRPGDAGVDRLRRGADQGFERRAERGAAAAASERLARVWAYGGLFDERLASAGAADGIGGDGLRTQHAQSARALRGLCDAHVRAAGGDQPVARAPLLVDAVRRALAAQQRRLCAAAQAPHQLFAAVSLVHRLPPAAARRARALPGAARAVAQEWRQGRAVQPRHAQPHLLLPQRDRLCGPPRRARSQPATRLVAPRRRLAEPVLDPVSSDLRRVATIKVGLGHDATHATRRGISTVDDTLDSSGDSGGHAAGDRSWGMTANASVPSQYTGGGRRIRRRAWWCARRTGGSSGWTASPRTRAGSAPGCARSSGSRCTRSNSNCSAKSCFCTSSSSTRPRASATSCSDRAVDAPTTTAPRPTRLPWVDCRLCAWVSL